MQRQAPMNVPPSLSEHQRKRGLFFLALAMAAVGFTMSLQGGLNSNFLIQELGIPAADNGYIEASRETCGILAFLLLALLSGLAEPLVGMAMLVLLGVGLGSYAFVPKDIVFVILLSVVWSQGLHVWMPLPNSMAMSLAEKGKVGYRLGQLSASAAVGSFVGVGLALLLSICKIPMRPMYVLAGGAAIFGAAACMGIPRNIKTPGPRLVFRAKYKLYYLLCFLEGWRKQIFLCFAGVMLVQMYKLDLWVMLVLTLIVQVFGYFFAPLVGKLIDRKGERPVLLFYYVAMIVIFVGYSQLPRWLPGYALPLCVLFIMDGAFFVFATALTTYVNRIAPPAEHTATLSMGVAMNHVASVTMPLVGTLLWKTFGFTWTFLIGTVAALGSIVAVQFIPPRQGFDPLPPQESDQAITITPPVGNEL